VNLLDQMIPVPPFMNHPTGYHLHHLSQTSNVKSHLRRSTFDFDFSTL
jgi:hypothetical protein